MNYLEEALREAKAGLESQHGGPFGAVIVKGDKIVGVGHNTVLKDQDATCHAEMNAIRNASKSLKTYDLSGCLLYTTSEPCPMCLSAIIWSNIKDVYYASDRKQVNDIGFRDGMIYDYLAGKTKLLNMNQIDSRECIKILNDYQNIIY